MGEIGRPAGPDRQFQIRFVDHTLPEILRCVMVSRPMPATLTSSVMARSTEGGIHQRFDLRLTRLGEMRGEQCRERLGRGEQRLDLPRFRGGVRIGISASGLTAFCPPLSMIFSLGRSIFSSRPACCQRRRVEWLSRTAGTLAVLIAATFRPLFDRREHDGMLVCTGFETVAAILAFELGG